MDTLFGWLHSAKRFGQEHWVWALTIAAITTLLLSPLITNPEYKSALRSLASVILASGVAGAVIRSSTFTEMFIERIVDVFYEARHLRSRKDLGDICTRTLNALLENESTALRGAVGPELLLNYLDFKLGFVYRDFRIQVQVTKVNHDGTIEILETVRATVIPNSGKSKIPLTWSWQSALSAKAHAELTSLSVDGKNIPKQEFDLPDESGKKRSSYDYTVKTDGDGTPLPFEIVRRVKKVIPVREDPIAIYRFVVPALDMSVELMDLPEGQVAVQLHALGLPRNFEPDRQETDGVGHWRSQAYSGLIFPRQGVILQWSMR